MKQRKDHKKTLENAQIPILLILGRKDAFIPVDLPNLIKLPKNSEVVILEKSGHQGYIEEKDKSLEVIKSFLKKYNV